MAPQTEETLLQFSVVILREIAEKAANHLTLFVGEIRNVVELMDVAQVGKDTVGICQIFVNIVEVSKQQLAPAVEFIEALVRPRAAAERLMEVADELDGVGSLECRLLTEEFADSDIGWAPNRLLGYACEMVVEEQ